MDGLIVNKVNPVYPEEAKAANVQGTVVLHALIGKDGHVASLSIVSGPAPLQDAAKEAVQQWVYRPYLVNGQPVEVDTNVSVVIGQTPTLLLPGRVRVSSKVMADMVLTQHKPIYPVDAKEARVEGAVVLRIVIGKDGKILELSPVSGPDMLRDAAINAVKQWTYRPYILNGEPKEVESTAIINFHFSNPIPLP